MARAARISSGTLECDIFTGMLMADFRPPKLSEMLNNSSVSASRLAAYPLPTVKLSNAPLPRACRSCTTWFAWLGRPG